MNTGRQKTPFQIRYTPIRKACLPRRPTGACSRSAVSRLIFPVSPAAVFLHPAARRMKKIPAMKSRKCLRLQKVIASAVSGKEAAYDPSFCGTYFLRGRNGIYPQTEKEILHDISFCVEKGETVGITGASGAGKSTLSRVVMGLLREDGGDIVFRESG